MSDIKLVIGADATQAEAALKRVQGELGKTASVANQSNTAIGGMASKFSQLGSTLLSGGVVTGIALLGAGLIELDKAMFAISKEQQMLNDVMAEAKSAYVKATLEVSNLKQAFSDARQGVISKEEALKLYNTTIGKTIGQTKDLDEAEYNLAAQAENYIKFTLLKAAANIALGKAAEAAFRAEQERFKGVQKESLLQKLLIGTPVGTNLEEVRQKKINDAIKEENQFKEIANSLQSQANQFGFDYNAISEKEVKIRKERIKAIKEEVAASRVAAIGNIKPFEPKLRGDLQTIFLQDVILKPSFKIEISDADRKRIAEGLQKLFDIARIEQLSEDFANQLRNVVQSTIQDTITGVADAAAAALSGGRDVIPNLFGGLMNNLGQQIQDLGKFLIKSAITIKVAKEAFQKLLANPVAAAIVGIGLVALGALLKQQASKQYKGFASGTTGIPEDGFFDVGERGRERIFLPRGTRVQPNNELQASGMGGITLMPSIQYSGDGFRIMLNKVDAQWRRNN